jgi:hypothetical protein
MANNILNPVSSRPAVGDEDQGITDDPSISKIYQGETLVYENAHSPIADNAIAYPWWNADTTYIAADAFTTDETYWSGHQSFGGIWANAYTQGWGYHSPLLDNDYAGYIGRYYLYRFAALNPPGTSTAQSGKYLDDEHVDLARTVDGYSSNALSGNGTGATAQKRILLMHGAGNLLSHTRNRDANRSYPLPPITSCATTTFGNFTNSTGGQSAWTTNDNERWVYTQMYTSLTAPDSATKCTFGAYVRQPSDDPLRTDNGGCVQLKEIFQGTQFLDGRVDNIIIRGDSSSRLTNLRTGSPNYTIDFKNNAHYQWSGPNHTSNYDGVDTNIHHWNQNVTISSHQFVDAADIDQFKKVTRTVDLRSATGRKYNFSVGFLENHANLHLSTGQSYGPTGAVWFYNCFAIFHT